MSPFTIDRVKTRIDRNNITIILIEIKVIIIITYRRRAYPQLSIFISHSLRYTLPSEPHVILSFSLSQVTGHALAEPTRLRSWLRQNAMGTSNTCLPQFLDFIRHALLYMLPSEPQVGFETRQHDSRQCRVVWQCFLDVLTTPCLPTNNFIFIFLCTFVYNTTIVYDITNLRISRATFS